MSHHQPAINVTWLRGVCSDDVTCPAITEIDTDPDHLYVIAEPVTDEAVLAAHAHRMAAHERLVRIPKTLAPEVTPR